MGIDNLTEDLPPHSNSSSDIKELDGSEFDLSNEKKNEVQPGTMERAIEVMALRIVITMALNRPDAEERISMMRSSLEEIGCDLEKLDIAIKEHQAIEEAAAKLVEVMKPTTPAEEKEMQDVLARIKEDGLDVGKIKKAIKRVSVRLHPDK